VLLSSVVLLAVSCGSDDEKLKASRDDAGGEAGQAGAAPGPGGPAGGSNGAAGEAGETSSAGTPAGPVGGAGGEAGAAIGAAAGAGGEPPIAACTPNGNALGVQLDSEPMYTVCRDARQIIPFQATDAAPEFTCCGLSASKPAYGLELAALSNPEGGGDFSFMIPAGAPLGAQFLTVTCAGGAADEGFSLEVSNGVAPVVAAVNELVASGDPLTITGTNLANVTRITVVGPETATYECGIEAQEETSIVCSFGSGVLSEGDYQLFVYQTTAATR
jgi:hypothetical protein